MKKLLLISLLLIATVLTSSLIQAEALIEGQHQLTSSIDNRDGTFSVSFSMSLLNNGIEDYSSLSLIPIPGQHLVIMPENNSLLIGNFPVGTSIEVIWNVITMVPGKMLTQSRPLIFIAQAVNASGYQVNFTVTTHDSITE